MTYVADENGFNPVVEFSGESTYPEEPKGYNWREENIMGLWMKLREFENERFLFDDFFLEKGCAKGGAGVWTSAKMNFDGLIVENG